MFLKFKLISIFIVFIFFSSCSIAQIQIIPDTSLKINSTNFFTNYNKFLNLHNFTSSINSNYEVNNFYFKLNNRFSSNIIFSNIKNIRDENYFDLRGRYKIINWFQPSISVESKRINDNRKIGISRFKDFSIKGWLISNPYSTFHLSPFFGYKSEEQFEIVETGKSFGFESYFNEYILNSRLTGNFKIINDQLNIRKNQLINSEFNAENFITDQLSATTRFSFHKIDRDYFTQIDSSTARIFNTNFNIEKRVDNIIDFSQKFDLITTSLINASLNGNIYYRVVEKKLKYKNLNEPSKNLFDSKVEEFRMYLNSETQVLFNKLNSIIRFSYLERSEKHSIKRISAIPEYLYYQRLDEELQKNNFSSRISLGIQNKINIISYDTLSTEASVSKLRYDTPTLDNYFNPLAITRDDRDELLFVIRLIYLKYFNNRLSTSFLLESFNNHLIYIYKEKSSNNNWNRVLRFSSGTSYKSSKLLTKNYFEVLANYTVYDFEDQFQTTQSFVFRQFGFQDSTKIFLAKKYFLTINFNLRFSEQGIFYWKKFSSLPGRFLNEKMLESKLGYELSSLSFISAGIRFTSLTEFNFRGKEKQIIFQMNSIGPILEGFLYYTKDFYLNFKCWIEYIRQTNQNTRRNINLNFNSYILF